MSSSAQLGEEGRGFSGRKVAGAGSQVLPAGVIRAVVLPDLLPQCHGNQAAREPRWRQSSRAW